MIKNERQYRITKTQLQRFEAALEHLTMPFTDERVHPRIRRAQLDSVRAQIDQLRGDIAEYEALRSGATPHFEWRGFHNLGDLLIKARIATGMTQRQLAERLKMKEQQVQRYEATAYAGASLTRLIAVANALDIDLQGGVSLPVAPLRFGELVRRLKGVGFDDDFIRRRLSGPVGAQQTSGDHDLDLDSASMYLTSNLRRIYGWEPHLILSDRAPSVDPRAVAAARFKVPANVSEPRLAAYTVYAHYLALLVLSATSTSPREVSHDPSAVRAEIIATYGKITFEEALRYVWDLGIPVLPLADPGAFHGALWRSEGRSVIVLKQRTRTEARWLFDLLHELYHAGELLEIGDLTILETDELLEEGRQVSTEWMASEFAGNILLEGRAHEIAERCAEEAGGSVERLKAVVPRVAAREGVRSDILANYLAYRLWHDKRINWWGAATNLQAHVPDPWIICRDVLFSRIHAAALAEEDRKLLQLALDEQ